MKKKEENINFDWRIKLKNNKILTKEPRVKMRNQENEERIEKNNIWQIVI
jgi:hypothetical protein